MNSIDDELLMRYARDGSEASFEELVRRHINLVYSAALRQVNGNAHLAEDATQTVFTDLARKAAKLSNHPSLSGWLYTTTRYVAANLRRAEQRRGVREQAAHTMNILLNTPGAEHDWAQISPLLDEAMYALDQPDREAVLMRFFEKRSFAEIGASCGLTENAARMRVDRALDKLHRTLAKQGITSTTVVLSGLLANQAVAEAPELLTGRIVGTAPAGAATTGAVSGMAFWLISATRTKILLSLTAVVLLGVLAYLAYHKHLRTASVERLAAISPPSDSNAVVSAASDPSSTNLPAMASIAASTTNGIVLHLTIVTSDTSQPIPLVPIEYRGWAGNQFEGKKFVSDRFGRCGVRYPPDTTELELTTRKDDFADTQLLWRPPNGEVIPNDYVLRLDRPVAIGGTVLDPDGRPVAGAKVGWNHDDDPAALTLPQNHNFGWIETTTDQDGRWRINRIAGDMIHRIYGSANQSNYVSTSLTFASRDKAVEEQLRAGIYIFNLGRAATVNGIVTDSAGVPVPDANILVGRRGEGGSRTGKSQGDGTFSIVGCKLGEELVTAEASGFAASSTGIDLKEQAQPVTIVLKPGKLLRLRVVDGMGNPIPNANVWYNGFDSSSGEANRAKPVQIDFSPKTDREGRVSLINAPDADMRFSAQAAGFVRSGDVSIHPDGEEHTIVLAKALVVHGVVWDQETGERIQKFRIATGWPRVNSVEGTTNAQWSNIGRFWLEYSGGAYSKSFEEPAIGGTQNPGFILKFMADGYAPFISRVLDPDEGEVELNVTLSRASAQCVTVYNPDGGLASDADIGLVFPGSGLSFTPGGISRQNIQSGGSLLRTGPNGTFSLEPDESVVSVIAASPEGYAETALATLRATPALQLQPWGRLEVAVTSGGQPAVGRDYSIEFGESLPHSISFNDSHVKTDAQGKFCFPKMPPGHHSVVKLISVQVNPGGMGWMSGKQTPVDIRSGETTQLELEDSN